MTGRHERIILPERSFPITPTSVSAHSSTVENYIKQIYLEAQKDTLERVPMKRLADGVGVSPGTATAMVKTLARSGLIDYAPRDGSRLTAAGEQLALNVLRRHRLVEAFLVEVLKLDWSEVHGEAELLEHAISDKVLEKISLRSSTMEHRSKLPANRPTVVEIERIVADALCVAVVHKPAWSGHDRGAPPYRGVRQRE